MCSSEFALHPQRDIGEANTETGNFCHQVRFVDEQVYETQNQGHHKSRRKSNSKCARVRCRCVCIITN